MNKNLHLLTLIWGSTLFFILGRPSQSQASDVSTQVTNRLLQLKLKTPEELEDVKVYTAAKYLQDKDLAPASVFVITKKDFEHQGYRNLAEALNSVPGFNVSDDRRFSYLGIRGLSLGDNNGRVLVLVDGHRVNDSLTDGAPVGNEFLLDPDLIERVEVVSGPGSVLYGNNAFFGVVNVITRKFGERTGVEASIDYGDLQSAKARFTLSKAFESGAGFWLSGSIYQSEGDSKLPNSFNDTNFTTITSRGMDREEYVKLFSSLSFKDLTIQAGLANRTKRDPTLQYFTALDDPRAKRSDLRGFIDVKYEKEIYEDVNVLVRGYCDYSQADIGYPIGPPLQGLLVYYNEQNRGSFSGGEVQITKLFNQKHRVSLGVEYRNDFSLSDKLTQPALNSADSNQSLINTVGHRDNFSLYGESDLMIGKKIHLEPGLRLDKYPEYDPLYSPRIALVYEPTTLSSLKLLYGSAFRTPNFQEQISAGEFLSSEKITTYQASYHQKYGENLNSTVTFFYNDLHNLILYKDGAYRAANAEARGAELSLQGGWSSGVNLRASCSLFNCGSIAYADGMPDSPAVLGKVDLTLPLIRDRLFLGVNVRCVSQRHTIYSDLAGGTTRYGTDVDGYSTLNITLFGHEIARNLDISLSLYNVLNEKYEDPATAGHLQDSISQRGRSFRLKVNYRF